MAKCIRWNSTYILTMFLWLIMAYIAWNFGYSVGRRSRDGTREQIAREDSVGSRYDSNLNALRNDGNNGIVSQERFPRPCRLDEGVDDKRHIVIFNSVTKCAGRTTLSLAFSLQQSLYLSVKSALNYSLETKDESTAKDYMNKIFRSLTPAGFVYTNTRFVSLTGSYTKTPVYISLIRDPMQRLASTFYHARFGDRLKARTIGAEAWNKYLEDKKLNITETFDDCVKAGKPECVGERTKGALIRQFCGYHSDCLTASPASLQRAKHNVKNHYMLVGILEEIDDFVKVLERLTPATFKGAFDKFESDARVQAVIADSKTLGLQTISEHTQTIIRKHLALDYEFYYFIQWRFLRQKQECGM